MGKPASQISNAILYPWATASLAVDGIKNPIFNGGSCTHTQSVPGAWWKVDLGAVYPVHHVQITNRQSMFKQLLHALHEIIP